MMPGQEMGFGALPPFTSAIERITPVLERLLLEGVSISFNGAAAVANDSNEYLRGFA
jgi:hypothetical protein